MVKTPSSTRRADPDEWSAFIKEHLRELGGGAREASPAEAAEPNGPIPASEGTIRRWRDAARQVVSVDKILEVCDALGVAPARVLVQVGVLRPEEFGVAALTNDRQVKLDPLTAKLERLLKNASIPGWGVTMLRDVVETAVKGWFAWMDMMNRRLPPAPAEPSARQRAAGARITERGGGR